MIPHLQHLESHKNSDPKTDTKENKIKLSRTRKIKQNNFNISCTLTYRNDQQGQLHMLIAPIVIHTCRNMLKKKG